jgi:hypothetical protein
MLGWPMDPGLADTPTWPEALGVPPSVKLVDSLGVETFARKHWAQDRSSVDIVRITELLSLVVSQGPGHPGSVPFYREHAPETCGQAGSVIYFDVSRLQSTDLGVVSTLMSVGKAHRHNLAEVHMLYTSPLIGMAVTVGNIALAGLVRLYREVEPFQIALEAAVLGRPGDG